VFFETLGLCITPKTHYRGGSKSKVGRTMDIELETWIDGVMEKQQYRNGIFSSGGVIHWLRKMTFGSK
tara:strand:+ start:207 stop:410 length:204 start_codon:yes stop_codon:yes gene_type:complete